MNIQLLVILTSFRFFIIILVLSQKKVLNLFTVKSYLKFLIKSSNQHGVHSPFVYDLITNCFYDKRNHSEYKKFNLYRKDLLKSSDIINIEDHGAGSLKFKTNRRNISDIAKIAGATISESKLLFRIVKYFEPKSILELGTSLAISTHTFITASKKAKITTIEGSKSIFDWNSSNTSKYNFAKTEFKNLLFDQYLEQLTKDDIFDFILIDGNHTYEATIKYFNILKNHTHNNSIIIFDDIHWSDEMKRAWGEIINDDNISVSIDTFHFGMVFFRKEQRKEHFVIRA